MSNNTNPNVVDCSSASVEERENGQTAHRFRFDMDAAIRLRDLFDQAVNEPESEGAVIVLNFGKVGNQKYPSGSVFVRAKKARQPEAGFKPRSSDGGSRRSA